MANILKYKGYIGTVEFNTDDNLLIGSVIGVQDSLNFHGNSIDEITQSFHDCIDGYLGMCEAFGRSPDKSYKGSFNIRLTPELHREAAIAAEGNGISLNQFIQNAIEDHLSATVAPSRMSFIQATIPSLTGHIVAPDYRSHYHRHGVPLSC